jgi:hypothetical protein
LAEQLPVSERAVSYKILGQAKRADNATEALIDILRILASRNPNFIEKVASLVPGTSRNHIAKRREDVYPNKPDLIEYTIQFVPGWWLGTNIANREKMRIIKQACRAEGLELGKDIISLYLTLADLHAPWVGSFATLAAIRLAAWSSHPLLHGEGCVISERSSNGKIVPVFGNIFPPDRKVNGSTLAQQVGELGDVGCDAPRCTN